MWSLYFQAAATVEVVAATEVVVTEAAAMVVVATEVVQVAMLVVSGWVDVGVGVGVV